MKMSEKNKNRVSRVILIALILVLVFFSYLVYFFLFIPDKIETQNGKYYLDNNLSSSLLGNCIVNSIWCGNGLCDMPHDATIDYYDLQNNLIKTCPSINCVGRRSICYPDGYFYINWSK